MSRGDWRTNASIVGGVIAVFVVAVAVTASAVSSYRQQHVDERADASNPKEGAAHQNAILYCRALPSEEQVRCAKEYVETEKANARAEYDLRAQQEMSEWALGVLFISAFGLFFSACGLAALVWTFREQRKLTQNQSRAYPEIVEAGLRADGIDITTGIAHYRIDIQIRNNGETPALNVRLQLEMTYAPEWDVGQEEALKGCVYPDMGGVGEDIPAKGEYIVTASGEGDDIRSPSQGQKSWRYKHPSVVVTGRVVYNDIFTSEDRHIPVRFSADIDKPFGFDPPVKLYGRHNWRVKDDPSDRKQSND